ncbi:MAG: hypothetical protein EBX66_05155, partial [Betaproteobacteria bacterium]|nr:hypothetical protein [Betaproteobacteria bacterium]
MNTSAQPRSCPELLGLRTVLGAVHADDAIHFMAMWQDPSFAKDAGIEATNNLLSLRQSLERFALLNASGLFYKWSIRLRDQATFVGEIEAYPLK